MRKVWNDLQKPLTWNDIERSETIMFSSKVPVTGHTLDERYKEIVRKHDYAVYLDKNTILGNILVDITFSEIMFIYAYLAISKPSSFSIIDGITM